jgi:cell division protein ZapD
VRNADCDRWAAFFARRAQAGSLLLQRLRDTGKRKVHPATGGQFQMNLPHGRDIQLLRLRIDPSLNLVPEISGNRFMLSVRLTRQSTVGQPEPVTADTPIELALCA